MLNILQKKDWSIDQYNFLTFHCPKCGKAFFRQLGKYSVNKNGVLISDFRCTPSIGGCEHQGRIRLYGWQGFWKEKGAS